MRYKAVGACVVCGQTLKYEVIHKEKGIEFINHLHESDHPFVGMIQVVEIKNEPPKQKGGERQ